jgi:hypothetical protein
MVRKRTLRNRTIVMNGFLISNIGYKTFYVQSKQNIDVVNQHEPEKDYFTEPEIDALLKIVKKSRYGTRDNLILGVQLNFQRF